MQTFSRVYSAQPHNLEGHIISVELDISPGIHKFTVIGLAGKAVDEARERVGSALKNGGWPSPKNTNNKTVISLAPAEIPKYGSYFDVAMALGYLLSRKAVHFDPESKIFLGELSLNGQVLPVKGVLPITQTAQKLGFAEIYVPVDNAEEAALVSDMTVYPIHTLDELIAHIDDRPKKQKRITPQPPTPVHKDESIYNQGIVDMSEIKGQESAKRGLEIAAAGGHNISMYGPPGTGKTTLAKALRGILPPLEIADALEVTGIHSIAGTLHTRVMTHPPFRSPHHTSSYVSIIGGGTKIKPGEVTLAHKGVLFMDEFPEFEPRVLESLRQPLEDKVVHIARASGFALFPTNFILVAALNPPPKDASPLEIQRHTKKISGPIIDRIDIWVPVEHIEYAELHNKAPSGEESATIRKRVLAARHRQYLRNNGVLNGMLTLKDIHTLIMTTDARTTLDKGAHMLGLSPRGYHRIIKLSRTIADLDGADIIETGHILEALNYRPKHSN